MTTQERTGRVTVSDVLSTLLFALGGLGLLAGIVVVASLAASPSDQPVGERVALLTLTALAGPVLAGLLWAAGHAIRRQHRALLMQGRILSALEALSQALAAWTRAPESSVNAAKTVTDVPVRQILDQLAELNTNVLLTEAQRQAKHQQIVQTAAERLTADFDRSIAHGWFTEAAEAVDTLANMAPDWPDLAAMRQRIEGARQAAEAEDVREATARCNDAMAIAVFDQAEAIATQLLESHPHSAAAAELLARVTREARTFGEESRRRMYVEIQKHASARQWRSALAAARALLDKYPDSPEARTLAMQMETIRNNASIEEVRELRDNIRAMISRKRFAEAVNLAQDLIERFPQTAAAEELRSQLARLQERADEAAGAKPR